MRSHPSRWLTYPIGRSRSADNLIDIVCPFCGPFMWAPHVIYVVDWLLITYTSLFCWPYRAYFTSNVFFTFDCSVNYYFSRRYFRRGYTTFNLYSYSNLGSHFSALGPNSYSLLGPSYHGVTIHDVFRSIPYLTVSAAATTTVASPDSD